MRTIRERDQIYGRRVSPYGREPYDTLWLRRLIAYVLCALIFGGGVLLAILLGGSPEPPDRHQSIYTRVSDPITYSVDGDVLSVETKQDRRRYRLHKYGEDITVKEIEESDLDRSRRSWADAIVAPGDPE